MAVTHALWRDSAEKSKQQKSKSEGTFWQKKKKNQIDGNCAVFDIDNKTVKLHYNTKINEEYNK